MLPNLFPFEGSTQPVVIARLNNREQVVEAEVAPDVDSARSRRSETPSPESRTGGDAVVVNGRLVYNPDLFLMVTLDVKIYVCIFIAAVHFQFD